MFVILEWHNVLAFLCLDEVTKWLCFVSFYCCLRAILSEVDVL